MNKLAIIYNEENKQKMLYEKESLEFHHLEFDFITLDKIKSNHIIIICDQSINFSLIKNKKIFLIADSIDKINFDNSVVFIQFSSEIIKNIYNNTFNTYNIPNIVLNVMPRQKPEINSLDSQNATIFYQGKDSPEDMVDEMFYLDEKTHYKIEFYKEGSEEPSKIHKLSWCVTKDENKIGIIHWKIINEIENGCLPILIKEYSPSFLFSYPFLIELNQLKSKELLIDKVKEISSFISKITKEEFKTLVNSVYNGIYIESNWKYNNYLMTEEMKFTLNNL